MAHVGDDRVQTEGVAEMLGEELLLVQGVQQVGVDSGHEHRDGDRGEGLLDPAALTSDVVAIDGVGEGDVCAGVEALEQLTGLVVEVALHGEASLRVAVGAERFLAFLRSRSEAGVELTLTPIRQVGDPSRCPQAPVGAASGVVVVAVLPAGVSLDRADLGGLDADLPGRGSRRGRDDAGRPSHLGVHCRPLQGSCATHRAPDDSQQFVNAQKRKELPLGSHHVSNAQSREPRPPGPPVRGWGPGARRSRTTTQDVGADDAVPVGVDDQIRPDESGPPGACVGVPGERVLHEDDVVSMPLPPHLVGNPHLRDDGPGLRREIAELNILHHHASSPGCADGVHTCAAGVAAHGIHDVRDTPWMGVGRCRLTPPREGRRQQEM